MLRLSKTGVPFSVDTDACNHQVGCALLQVSEDGTRHPIGFWSRSLSAAERNYSVGEKECLAIVWAVQMLRPYLEGTHFHLFTDHQALKWILSGSDHSGRLARWRLGLLEFDFTISYKKGIKNTIADAVSRLPTYGESDFAPDIDVPCYVVESKLAGDVRHLHDPVEDQDFDPFEIGHRCPSIECEEYFDDHFDEVDGEELFDSNTGVLTTEVAAGPTPISYDEIVQAQASDPDCPEFKRRLETDSSLPLVENYNCVLCLLAPKDHSEQIVLPKSLRERALLLGHYPPMSGHPGGSRMYQTMCRTFYWPSMAMDVYNTVRQCSSCAKERIALRKHSSFLRLFPAQKPLEFVAIDILGPLPRSSSGNRYLPAITDRFSKMVQTAPLRPITADAVAKAFCEAWVFKFGPPTLLLSDNGGQLTSKFFQHGGKILGVRQLFTTAYQPQTNGQVERFNRTILAGLRHFCSEYGRDWDEFSSAITIAYNNTVHRATGPTPLQLAYPASVSSVARERRTNRPLRSGPAPTPR